MKYVSGAMFFHIGPTFSHRRFSQGTINAVLLSLPVGIWSYYRAYLDGALTIRIGVLSALGGVFLMAYPIVLLRFRRCLSNHKSKI